MREHRVTWILITLAVLALGHAEGQTTLLTAGFSGSSVPAGWASPIPGAWSVQGGVLKQTQYLPNTRYVLSYAPGAVWSDYRAEVDMSSDGWYNPSALGLYFRYQDYDNTYVLYAHANGAVYLDKIVGGVVTELETQTIGSPAIEDPARYAVEVSGTTIKAYRNGTLLITASDSTFSTGTIGLESVHIPGYFDNVLVQSSTVQHNGTILLTGGSLAGQALSGSSWEVTVSPDQQITGTIQLQTNNLMGSNAVAPFGYTWTWGSRQSDLVTVNSSIPTGVQSWSVSFNRTAPSIPGTYYILFGFNGEYTIEQVMSCSNWSYGSVVWNDGNDYFDVSPSQLATAHSVGYVANWPLKFTSGNNLFDIPLAPIKVTVVSCTAPGSFSLTSPTAAQTFPTGTSSVTLQWGASSSATSYDVYFGTSSSPSLLANQTSTSKTVSVSDGQSYYWKVVARNSCGTTSSSSGTRSFNVTAPPVIQHNGTILLTGGSLAGQALSGSSWEVTVSPDQQITGTIQLQTNNLMGSNAVAPFGYTWTWGSRQSDLVTVNSSIPTGVQSWSVSFNRTAPSIPGTYYILFGFNGEYTIEQVMSCSNWSYGSVVWNDGNDYFDVSPSQLATAHSVGYVANWPLKFTSGNNLFDIPLAPIKVVVQPGTGTIHPADTSDNWRMEIDEVTAYGNAWKTGATWTRQPNPIPIDYVTNAGLLWKTGEAYHYDANRTPPWATGASRPAGTVSGLALLGSGTAQCALSPSTYIAGQGVQVTITVAPDAATQVYAVEDAPPSGWSALSIAGGGQWDAVNAKVKWGPFFDNQARTLTYTATPPAGSSGTKAFSGTASFDGSNVAIGGTRSIAPVSSGGGNTAVSTLTPTAYTAGQPIQVSLVVSPAGTAQVYAVEDTPPAGWVTSGITGGGQWDSVNGKVKWGPFFDNQERTLTYSATPPAGTSGTMAFIGTASFDGSNVAVTGQRTLGPVPPPADGIWLAVASHTGGANNSQWRSDLGITNPNSSTASFEVRFHGSSGILTSTAFVTANGQSILQDVVGQLGGSGSGAIEVRADQPVRVTGRTYNLLASSAGCYPNGTLGQDYVGFKVQDGLAAGQTAILGQLTESTAYRTNIGLTNGGTGKATVTVTLYDGAGSQLKTYTVTLDPGQWKQENQPFSSKAGQTNMQRGWAKVTVTAGSGVYAYASVIDNITNDPTTIPMQK